MNCKRIVSFSIVLLILFLSAFSCSAANVEKEKVYNPLDLVVVIDSSGSMNDSDPNKTALDAVRMLVNMMPAKDSRVGIVSFSRTASILTKDSSGRDSLIGLGEFSGVETIRSKVSGIRYNGGTGIGNALYAATDLLSKSSDTDHTKAIIIFTDGVNDFKTKIAAAQCDENELKAIRWAKDSKCQIYSVGYDYVTSNGVSSMGTNGEGLKKLINISDNTGGKFKSINNISDIEQLLIEFLADVCDLNYKTIATIPGDGGKHECKIPVSPSVIEANIRIAGGNNGSIKNGDVRLYNPDGKEVQLQNSGNIRYDADATAASIKVIMPTSGDWILSVNGISGDDIHVGLLEHFKMNLTSQLILPFENPKGVAYANDEVGIKTWLSYDGKTIQDNDLYDAVTSAKAICVSRANPNDKIEITLERKGKSFVGSFIIPEDSYYDITVRLDWNTVYREDTSLEIKSTTPPPQPKGKINAFWVEKGKTKVINNIFSYVQTSDGRPLSVSIKGSTNEEAVKLKIDDDKLEVAGIKGWFAGSYITLEYKDSQGNIALQSFTVHVWDHIAGLIIALFVLLIMVAVILVIRFFRNLTVKIPGKMKILLLSKGYVDSFDNFQNEEIVYLNPNFAYDKPTVARPHSFGNGGRSNNPFGGINKGSPTAFGSETSSAFSGNKNSSFGNSVVFGTSKNSGFVFGSGQPSQQSQATTSDSVFNKQNKTLSEQIDEQEKMKSDRFDFPVTLSDKDKKKTLFAVLEKFIKNYGEVMNEPGAVSQLYKKTEEFISNSLAIQSSKIMIFGTPLNGLGGLILKKPKVHNKSIIFHKPVFDKKIKLNSRSNEYIISVSFIYGEKDEDGNVSANHIEIKYYNR